MVSCVESASNAASRQAPQSVEAAQVDSVFEVSHKVGRGRWWLHMLTDTCTYISMYVLYAHILQNTVFGMMCTHPDTCTYICMYVCTYVHAYIVHNWCDLYTHLPTCLCAYLYVHTVKHSYNKLLYNKVLDITKQ